MLSDSHKLVAVEYLLHPEEPVFLLRGHDPNASDTVRFWAVSRLNAIERGEKPPSDMIKVNSALDVANEMDRYRSGVAAQARLAL